MGNLYFKGKLKFYYLAPLYMIGVFFLCSFGLFFYDKRLACVLTAVLGLGWMVVMLLTVITWRRLEQELVSFATEYGMAQRDLLRQFHLPYALLDTSGRILWINDRFVETTGKPRDYRKSITSIFHTITRESIEKHEEETFSYELHYNSKVYRAELVRLHFEAQDEDAADSPILSFMLFDETELSQYKKIYVDQKLVTGLVYIDNYEETLEEVEAVKRSLLTAVIDRKVNKYFERAGAIVRKLEKDKYFILFQNQYLQQMEEDKFALLEDIKTTKAGNDNEVTLSIGIGAGGESYLQSAEFARSAIGLALGRGGSQAVVKSGQDISYYGMRGKEVEKNSRVKARVKAQALRELMATRDKVFVMGHQIADVDALGSAIGIYCAARELGKKCQIVLNTVTTSLRPFVDYFTKENGYPEDMFIDSQEARESQTRNTLVVVVDTNRPNYTECPEILKRRKNVVVFDHHRQGKEQIKNPLLSYIEPYASSACEMIAEVLQYFTEHIVLTSGEADCIYAGILIDTNNFMTKTGVRTCEAAAYLRRNGAEVTRVRKLLRENMEAYKARAEVVRHAEVYRGAFAISTCPAGDLESPTVVSAQAANELLNIVGIKASFVMTEFRDKIYVSARSIDEIDVQVVMERLGGGGHLNVAGAQIADSTTDEVAERIRRLLDDMIEDGEIEL
ncbi:MAG: DHH family phosphoesterase [Lachnospiraceae bacterium]|nr:DHH family phosphoesterase [Lachnospiraceae bacterium]